MKLLLLFGLIALLSVSGCASDPQMDRVPVAVTDTKPLGEGLKTLAYAFLGASVVLTLGRLLR
jgi:uncharacterized membrane protein